VSRQGGADGGRELRLLEVQPGPTGVTALLAALPAALAGDGPALAVAPAGEDPYAARARAAVLGATGTTVAADVAVVLATSGSTGSPRGVLLPGAALLASARATLDHLGGPGAWLLALPVTGVAGLQVLVRSLLGQTEPVVLASVGGASSFEPAEFAAATWRLDPSVPAYTALVPAQVSRLLDDVDGLGALRAYEAVLVGGARTPQSLLDRLADAHVAAVTTYGMTETSGGLFYDGIPIASAVARILDPDSAGVGRVALSGPMLARGYLDDADATAAAFADGTHLTGDVGRLHGDELEVLGRLDDVVQVGGVNVAVSAVEDLLASVLDDACVLTSPDETWGHRLTAYVAGAASDDATLAALVRESLGSAAVPRTWVHLEAIPHLPTGKPDRATLRDLSR
jgi:O-succinylbenzoic acid--CoA ligase